MLMIFELYNRSAGAHCWRASAKLSVLSVDRCTLWELCQPEEAALSLSCQLRWQVRASLSLRTRDGLVVKRDFTSRICCCLKDIVALLRRLS
jgi:hypothetical protein